MLWCNELYGAIDGNFILGKNRTSLVAMYTNSANGNGDVETTKFTDGDWGQTKRCGNQPERYQSRENRSLTTSPVLGAAVCDKPTLKRTGRKFHQRSPSIRFYVEIRYRYDTHVQIWADGGHRRTDYFDLR